MSRASHHHHSHTTHVLVDLAQDGDKYALNQLLDRYMPRVKRVVRMKRGPFLGQRLDDQDLSQEVMIRVWRSLKKYDPQQTVSFLLWVTRIADNALRDLARRQLAAKRNPGSILSLEEEHERGVPDSATHPINTATPSRLISRAEDVDVLDQTVASFPEGTQTLLILRYYYDLPLEDIGKHFKVQTEAVRSRIRRALAQLKKLLEERGVQGADNPVQLIRRSF